MKKLNAMLAILLVVALLAGCSGAAEKPAGTVETIPVTEAMPTGETETVPTETEPVTEAAEDETVAMGRMVGGVYTNSYTGYACQLDSNWTFYSAEELQEMPANVAEILGDSDLLDDETVLSQFTDMMAENATDPASMNVAYTKLPIQERVIYAMMDDAAVVDTILQQKDTLLEVYANAGITVESMESVTINFLGEERVAIHTAASIQGIPYYMLQISDFGLGAYGVTLTLATYLEDNTADLAALFYAVE